MKISDQLWESMLRSAHKQYESYVRRGIVNTPEQRMKAIDDALQHAVALLQAAEFHNEI